MLKKILIGLMGVLLVGHIAFADNTDTWKTFVNDNGSGTEIIDANDFNPLFLHITGDILPRATSGARSSANTYALGSTTYPWLSLFLGNGGVINWNNGNFILTHATGQLTASGNLDVNGIMALGSTGTITDSNVLRVSHTFSTDASNTGIISLANSTGHQTAGNRTFISYNTSFTANSSGQTLTNYYAYVANAPVVATAITNTQGFRAYLNTAATNNTGFYANVSGGLTSNYSFCGDAGNFLNKGLASFGSGAAILTADVINASNSFSDDDSHNCFLSIITSTGHLTANNRYLRGMYIGNTANSPGNTLYGAVGVEVASPVATSAITNVYGVKLDSTTGTNNYGVYSNASGGTLNYSFYGNAGQAVQPDGTVSLPAWSFKDDLNCGLYRIGTDNIGIAVNGTKLLDVSTARLNVTQGLDVDGTMALGSGGAISSAVTLLLTHTFSNDGSNLGAQLNVTSAGHLTAGNRSLWGIQSSPVANSAGNTLANCYGFYTAAVATTAITNVYSYYAGSPTATSAITNSYGYYATLTTAATNNYAFYANASGGGTLNYSFYGAAGLMYNAGNLSIGGYAGIGIAPDSTYSIYSYATINNVRIAYASGQTGLIYFTEATTNKMLCGYDDATNQGEISTLTATPLILGTNNTTRITIDGSTGAVLLGGDIYTVAFTDISANIVGYASPPATSCYYKRVGNIVTVYFNISGTSNSINFWVTGLPTAAAHPTSFQNPIRAQDNTGAITVGFALISAGGTTMNFYSTVASGGWTNTGTKSAYGTLVYEAQ